MMLNGPNKLYYIFTLVCVCDRSEIKKAMNLTGNKVGVKRERKEGEKL